LEQEWADGGALAAGVARRAEQVGLTGRVRRSRARAAAIGVVALAVFFALVEVSAGAGLTGQVQLGSGGDGVAGRVFSLPGARGRDRVTSGGWQPARRWG
jgi:hypothetical protein